MPRSGYKVVIVMKLDVYSGTEVHVYNGTDPIGAANAAVDLAKLRIAMLPPQADVVKIRLSNLVAPFDTYLLDTTLWAGVGHWVAPTNIVGSADQPKSSIQVRFSTAQRAAGTGYLFAVPDTIIGEAPVGVAPRMDPSWQVAFNNWKAKLKVGWGMTARTPRAAGFAPVDVVVTSSDPLDGSLQVVTIGTLGGATIRTPVQLRGFQRSNVAYVSANGKYQIAKIEPDTPVPGRTRYTLAGKRTVDPGTIEFNGTVEIVDYRYESYTDVTIQGQTTRKRGNRSLVGPGKRRTRKFV